LFECVCLVTVFVLMIYLIRRRVDVSYALVAGAVALGLLFGVRWAELPRGLGQSLIGIGRNLGRAAIDRETLELAGLVLFIQFLGHALKHSAHLDRLMAALKALLRDRRAAMAAAPAFIGLLPMPGGALFSAPMVGELTGDLDLAPEDRTLINYWFRHVWEWTWPLYPGILFAAARVGAPLGTTILAASPFTLGAIAIGTIFLLRRVRLPAHAASPSAAGNWGELLAAAWPVGLIVLLTAAMGVAKFLKLPVGLPTQTALLVALVVVNPLFLIVNRVPWRDVAKLARATFQPSMVLLVYGVQAFGQMLDAYGAATELPRIFAEWGVPPSVLLFAVPLVVGLLTGYMPAAVGICFPVLVPLIVEATAAGPAIHYGRMAFAYAGGLFGVLLSPVHLCLVLSREHFKADFGQVYRGLFRLMAPLAAVAVGTWLLWEALGLR
jgi:integral membrane protein (TIGR00529 family)